MRKIKLFSFALVATLFLVSCGDNGVDSSTSSSNVADSSASSSAACDETDYVSQVHLSLDYVGKDFLTDGIGPVSLKENVDGDTTHFYPIKSDGTINKDVTIKSRYLCIDTPESTGQVQPWGKAASHYTASQIDAAKTIVISSDSTTYGAAKADSTGSRYLSYVWVSDKANASLSDLKLLNLMIVQNGYSATKSATDSIYSSYFYAADSEAQCKKLVIWSGESDPDYIYTTGVSTTLQYINLGKRYDEDTGDYVDYDWTDSTHNKVAFDCYVALSEEGNAYVYMDYPDMSDPSKTVRYGMYVFAGYRNISPLTHVGWKLNIVGICTTFNGNLQITSVEYSALYHSDDDITVLDKTGSTYTPLEASTSASEASSDTYENVVIQINNLHGVESGSYADDDGGAFTVHCLDENSDAIDLRFEKGVVTDRNDITITINSTNYISYFTQSGETFNVFAPVVRFVSSTNKTHYQLSLTNNKYLVFNS